MKTKMYKNGSQRGVAGWLARRGMDSYWRFTESATGERRCLCYSPAWGQATNMDKGLRCGMSYVEFKDLVSRAAEPGTVTATHKALQP